MKKLLMAAAVTGIATAAFLEIEPAVAQSSADALEEIIITARRREESLQEVPVAVSAFGVDDIVNRNIRNVEDIARFTPGLSLPKAFGRSTDRPVIRGQGNVLAGVQFGVESGAAYFVDGVYYPGDLSSLNLNDLQRVEVIRGPQAALYGRNTYSGAINFITQGPGDSPNATVRARYGEDDEQEIFLNVGGPMGDMFAGSLSARYYSLDGLFDNITTGRKVGDEETTSIFGRLDFSPTENFTLSLRGNYQEDRDGTRAFFLQPSESNNCFEGTRSNASWLWTGSTNNNQYYCGEINARGDTVQLNDGPVVNTVVVPGIPNADLPGFSLPFPGSPLPPGVFQGGPPYNTDTGVAFSGVERDITWLSLQGDWEFGNGYALIGSVTSRTEDRRTGSDSDHTSVNFKSADAFGPVPPPANTVECFFCASAGAEDEDYSAELRLESPVEQRARWMIGAFYYDQTTELFDITFAGDTPTLDESTVENTAVFGSFEYDFTEAFTATLELRWFDEKKGLTEDVNTVDALNFEEDFSEVAPRVTANWKVSEGTILYGIYAKGYKPGGVIGSAGAELTPPTTTYLQEESDNFELGVKTSFAEGRVIFNGAVFFIDAEDIQLTTPLQSGGSGTFTSVVTNQGSGETFGVELDATWLVNDYLTVGATYALASTEFTEGCDDFQWTLTSGGGQLLDAEACTGSSPNGSGSGSIVGNQFPLSSENQFSAFADLRVASFGESEFFANLSYSWEDEKPVQVHNQAWVPAASLLDLRFGWETDTWTVAIYGRNLTDEDAPSMATRWLQDPLLSIFAAGPFGALQSPEAAGAPAGFCDDNPCITNFPRAFFADLRRGRNIGIEATLRFGSR